MNAEMIKLLHEQLKKYSDDLTIKEKEMVRKARNNEDYSKDLKECKDLKEMQKACIIEIARYK